MRLYAHSLASESCLQTHLAVRPTPAPTAKSAIQNRSKKHQDPFIHFNSVKSCQIKTSSLISEKECEQHTGPVSNSIGLWCAKGWYYRHCGGKESMILIHWLSMVKPWAPLVSLASLRVQEWDCWSPDGGLSHQPLVIMSNAKVGSLNNTRQHRRRKIMFKGPGNMTLAGLGKGVFSSLFPSFALHICLL